jgi:hypothetical protein
MALIRIPKRRGKVVFARSAKLDVIGRYTVHHLKYTGASWGFGRTLITWTLWIDGRRLTHPEITLDRSHERRLIERKRPLEAQTRAGRLTIPITLRESNPKGSCVMWLELRIDPKKGTAKLHEKSVYVDISS